MALVPFKFVKCVWLNRQVAAAFATARARCDEARDELSPLIRQGSSWSGRTVELCIVAAHCSKKRLPASRALIAVVLLCRS